MDKKYWNEYYKKDLVEKKPSLFAQFVFDKYLEKGKNSNKKSTSLVDSDINITLYKSASAVMNFVCFLSIF